MNNEWNAILLFYGCNLECAANTVYVIIGLFVLASTTAFYQCLEPIVRRIPIGAFKYYVPLLQNIFTETRDNKSVVLIFLIIIHFFLLIIRLPSCNLSFVQIHVEVRQLVLFIASVSLAASWVVYRKEKFAWILQDILGFAFRYCCCALFCSGHSTIVYCTAQKSSSSQVRN